MPRTLQTTEQRAHILRAIAVKTASALRNIEAAAELYVPVCNEQEQEEKPTDLATISGQ